jgi:hypothetical protein
MQPQGGASSALKRSKKWPCVMAQSSVDIPHSTFLKVLAPGSGRDFGLDFNTHQILVEMIPAFRLDPLPGKNVCFSGEIETQLLVEGNDTGDR